MQELKEFPLKKSITTKKNASRRQWTLSSLCLNSTPSIWSRSSTTTSPQVRLERFSSLSYEIILVSLECFDTYREYHVDLSSLTCPFREPRREDEGQGKTDENSWDSVTPIHFSGATNFFGHKNEFTNHQFETGVLESPSMSFIPLSNHQTVVKPQSSW